MYVISCGNSSGAERPQQHHIIETITTSKNVRGKKKRDKTHILLISTNTVTVCSLWDNMTDVIAALNCMYVAEWTACEWAEALTLKKDLHVRLAMGRIEKVKNERKTLRQMKSVLRHCWKDQIRPRKTGPLPSTLLHTNALTVQTL